MWSVWDANRALRNGSGAQLNFRALDERLLAWNVNEVCEIKFEYLIVNRRWTRLKLFFHRILTLPPRCCWVIYHLRLIVHRTYCQNKELRPTVKKNRNEKWFQCAARTDTMLKLDPSNCYTSEEKFMLFFFLIFGWVVCMARDGRKSFDFRFYISMNDWDFYDRHGDAWFSNFGICPVSDLPLSLAATWRFGLLFLSTYVWCSWCSMMMMLLLRLLPAISMQMKHEDKISISFPVFVCLFYFVPKYGTRADQRVVILFTSTHWHTLSGCLRIKLRNIAVFQIGNLFVCGPVPFNDERIIFKR